MFLMLCLKHEEFRQEVSIKVLKDILLDIEKIWMMNAGSLSLSKIFIRELLNY